MINKTTLTHGLKVSYKIWKTIGDLLALFPNHMLSHTAQGRPWPGPIWSTHIWGAPFAKALYGIVLGWYGIVLGAEFQDDEIPNLASLNTILDIRIFGQNAHSAGSKNTFGCIHIDMR